MFSFANKFVICLFTDLRHWGAQRVPRLGCNFLGILRMGPSNYASYFGKITAILNSRVNTLNTLCLGNLFIRFDLIGAEGDIPRAYILDEWSYHGHKGWFFFVLFFSWL